MMNCKSKFRERRGGSLNRADMRKTGRLMVLMLAVLVTPSLGQLDDSWTVSLNGQTVQVNPNGSFRIPNVAAADEFGESGPGSAPDFLSDDPLVLTGYSTAGGTTRYVYTEPFRMPQAETFIIGTLIFSDDPPPYPESIMATAVSKTLTVGEQTKITVTGTLLDGSQVDISGSAVGTTYRVSNPLAADVGSDGVVTALLPGTVFVTVVNLGSTSVLRIDIVSPMIDTTVEGFVQRDDGSGVASANVSLSTGDVATTDGTGLYSVVVQSDANAIISATATLGDETGESPAMPVVANGITDLGIITLDAEPIEQELIFSSLALEAGYGTEAVVAEDFNGDGLPDVALVDESDNLVIHLNQGGGVFGAPFVYNVDSASSMAVADLDGDDDLDIVTASSANREMGLFINNGNGTFSAPIFFNTVDNPRSISVGDIDGDNDNDVVLGMGFSEEFRVYVNPGNAVFGDPQVIAVPAIIQDATLSDVNDDGAVDLVFRADGFGKSVGCLSSAGCSGQEIGIMINDGSGVFAAPQYVQAGGLVQYFQSVDVNGDQQPDIVYADGFGGNFGVLLNNGDGSYGEPLLTPIEFASGPFLVTDFNDDGQQDLVLPGRNDPESAAFLGAGDGTFTLARRFNMFGQTVTPDAADFDGDGDEDAIFAARWAGHVRIHHNNGSNGYLLDGYYQAGTPGIDMAQGDFDADGHIDVAGISYNRIGVIFGGGTGSFVGDVSIETGCDGYAVAAGDIDGDGDADIVGAQTYCDQGELSVVRSNGDRTFASVVHVGSFDDVEILAIKLVDVDADTDLDVVAGFTGSVVVNANQDTDPSAAGIEEGGFAVFLNDGQGNFGDPIVRDEVAPITDIALGDMDGAGGVDLVSVRYPNSVAVYSGNGDGTFAAAQDFEAGEFAGRLDLADMDGDGDVDVVASSPLFGAFFGGDIFGEDGPQPFFNVYLLENQGDGTLSQSMAIPAGFVPRNVALANVSGNDLPDIITSNLDTNSLSVMTNLGGNGFSPPVRYAAGIFPVAILTGDYDGDGDIDVITNGGDEFDDLNENVGGQVGAGIAVLLNRAVPPDCDANSVGDDVDIWSDSTADCNLNSLPDACDVDCDGNDAVDLCEIADGLADCNGNQLLDACETDCNGNNIPDDCDIVGLENDCNRNGVPDSCDDASGVLTDSDGNGLYDECERVLFVAADGPDDGDGRSWDTAFDTLQEALMAAANAYAPGTRTEVCVKAGTYTPDNNRFISFEMHNGVEWYGGFAGSEDPASFDLSTRDLMANETVLSGDLNGNDPDIAPFIGCFSGPGFAYADGCDEFDLDMDGDVDRGDQVSYVNIADNSLHVVRARGVDNTAVIDGFTIVGGNANGGSNDNAGGAIMIGRFPQSGSPIVRNCRMINNSATVQGGAVFVTEQGSNPRIEDCTFILNRAGTAGGACSIVRQSRPVLIDQTFIKNSSGDGGAMVITDSSVAMVYNGHFVQNMAHDTGGAISVLNSGGSSTFVNGVFVGNGAVQHGSVSRNGNGKLNMINCTLAGNVSEPGTVHTNDAFNPNTNFRNCILWNNANRLGVVSSPQVLVADGFVTVTNSIMENGWNGPGMSSVVDVDPLFVNQAGLDGVVGTLDDDLRVTSNSGAIDAADETYLPADVHDLDFDDDTTELIPFDFIGNSRIANDVLDIGAYETIP